MALDDLHLVSHSIQWGCSISCTAPTLLLDLSLPDGIAVKGTSCSARCVSAGGGDSALIAMHDAHQAAPTHVE